MHWLFRSRTLAVTAWRCQGHEKREKYQPWAALSFVHSGAFGMRCPRGTTLVDSNNVLLMKPFEPYETSHPLGCGDYGSGIILAADTARDLPGLGEESALPQGVPGRTVPSASRLFLLQGLLAHELHRSGPVEPLAVEEAALRLCRMVLGPAPGGEERQGSRAARRATEHVEAAKELLHRRLPEPLQLAELATALGLSPEYLCRLFRRRCGMTLSGYRNRLRLRQAVAALADGAEDLTDLALSLGFSSHSHFTFAFRREFGVPPSRVRRLAAAGSRSMA